MQMLAQIILELIAYFLCIVVVRVVTFGWVRVDLNDSYFHNGWFMRTYDGTILLREGAGVAVGFLLVIAIVVGTVVGIRHLGWT